MSSPNSAEINEEMQEDDGSLPKQQQQEPSVSCSSSVDQQTPIPQNPNQEIQIQQNLDQEIKNPQNPDQEIIIPQNPIQEIQNPQNLVREIQNPLNPVQEIQNPLNPLEETQNPENPQQEESKWQKEANKIIKMKLELKKQRQLEHDKQQNRPPRRPRQVTRFAPMKPPLPPKKPTKDDDNDGGISSEDSDTFEETDEGEGFHDLLYREHEEMFGDGGNAKSVEQGISGKGVAEDCILFVVKSRNEEDDDVKTMNYVLAYVQQGNRIPQKWEDYKTLYSYITGCGECIILEVLEEKLNKLKNKFFVLMERMRLFPGTPLTDYDGFLQSFGAEVWGSERPLTEEQVIRESIAMFEAKKAKDDCILFERSTSEEDDDITTMNYFEAYVRDPLTSLEISTSDENLKTLYTVISSQGEDIKLEVLKQKVVKLRKKYSMLRDRISTDPGANSTLRPYEIEMHRLGKEVWGSRMLEETGRFGIRDQETSSIPTSIDAPSSIDDKILKKHNEELESYHVRNASQLSQLMQHLQFGGNGGDKKQRRQEVEAALRHLYGQKGDEWTKKYKKVEEMQMDDELAKAYKKDQCENEELCREKSATLFDDDWEVAEDCILFKRSKSEIEDDIMTLKCVIAYIHRDTGQVADDFEVLYGAIRNYGVGVNSLEVLVKKLAKLLKKYLMLIERIRLSPRMTLTDYEAILHRFGTEVWGSRMLEGTLPLLDSRGVGITDQEHSLIADLRASARRRQQRQFRISQDPTIHSQRIISPAPTSSFPSSFDEAFDSQCALNPNRGVVIKDAEKPPDDPPPEVAPDLKAKAKRPAEEGAPNQRPRKFQYVEKLLLLFQGAETEEEDDLILLRYASAYGRNVTLPTARGLYEFILANLPTGESISWFLLKLKITMLEKRYLTMLRVLDSNGNMEAYTTGYHRELYRLGKQFWGDETRDQNPDGNMGTKGASGGASGSGGGGGS